MNKTQIKEIKGENSVIKTRIKWYLSSSHNKKSYNSTKEDNNKQFKSDDENYEDFFNDYDLEELFVLENKIKEIIIKLNSNMFNECFEWINYYYDNNIYYKFIKDSKKNFHLYY